MRLNEPLSIVLTPVGAIFLVRFGNGLLSPDQPAMQLRGGQFRARYLAHVIGFEGLIWESIKPVPLKPS